MPRILAALPALALLAAACGGGGSVLTTVTTQPTATTAGATTLPGGSTTTSPASEPVSFLSWARVAGNEAAMASAAMWAVTAGGPGLAAVGYETLDFQWDAAVWVSADGLSWSRVPGDRAVFGGPADQEMVAVTAGGPGLVAAGNDYSGGDRDAAVWVSADGLTWTRIPHDEAVFGGPGLQDIRGLAAGGPGLVAVGYDSSSNEGDGAVWVSADGLAWSRLPDAEGVFGGPGEQSIRAVAAGGPGLVAVGLDFSDRESKAAVWVSADGLAWSRVPHDAEVFGGLGWYEMNAVAVGPAGLVAVGRAIGADGDPEDTIDGAVWVSADGLAWSRVPHDEAVFGGPETQEMTGVASGPAGVAAVGYDSTGVPSAAVWVGPPPG